MTMISPATRRANRWLLLGLICFAVGLCALVLWWMRVTVRAKGGIVDPRARQTTFQPPAEAGRFLTRLALEFSRASIFTAPQHSL